VEDHPLRLFASLALASAMFRGACQNPDGSVNVPGIIAPGAGVAPAGLAIASSGSNASRHGDRRDARGHRGNKPRHGYRRW
jgi:hypothetical protein